MRALILPTVHRAELPTPREEDGTAACPTPGERKLEHSASSAEGFHGGGVAGAGGARRAPSLVLLSATKPRGLGLQPRREAAFPASAPAGCSV